jgi:hypothetical protein
MMVAALVLGLAASAYGVVGDLTLKSCDPNMGGFMAMTRDARDFRPAPADCGTVNPNAKLITLHAAGMIGLSDEAAMVVALDSAKADDKVLDVLRLDAAGTGKFTAEASIPLKWSTTEGMSMAAIQPQTFRLTRGGRQVPVTVRGNLNSTASGPESVYLQLGACLEGECAFGEKVRTVRIVDATGNLKMTDPAKVTLKNGVPAGVAMGDTIMIEADASAGNSPFSAPPDADGKRFGLSGSYGQPAFVDGKWYDVAVSADGAKVTATPAKGPFGRIKLDAEQWLAVLISAEHFLVLEAGQSPVEVPVGKYVVMQSQLTKNKSMAILGDYSNLAEGKAVMFEVVADKVVDSPFGAPFTTRVEAKPVGRTVTLTPILKDSGGRSVSRLMSMEPNAKSGQFEVYAPDGKLVYSAALEFS